MTSVKIIPDVKCSWAHSDESGFKLIISFPDSSVLEYSIVMSLNKINAFLNDVNAKKDSQVGGMWLDYIRCSLIHNNSSGIFLSLNLGDYDVLKLSPTLGSLLLEELKRVAQEWK